MSAQHASSDFNREPPDYPGPRAAVCIHKHNAHRSLDLFLQPNQSGCLSVSNSLYDWLSVSYNFDPADVPMR